jgi:hypothetical protein
MSKGQIVQHLGEGQYRIRQKLAVERIEQELVRINDRVAQLAIDLPNKKADLLIAEDAVKDKIREINLKIPDLQAGIDGARKEITDLQVQIIQLQSSARLLEIEVSELIAENLSLLKRRVKLEAVPDGRDMDAWCADYSLELSGEVGLVDVNDEGGKGTVIHPGFTDGALYNTVRDGALFPNAAQTAAQTYFNAAILPGVQKWRPQYRIGTISGLLGDVCDIALDDAKSSAQGLGINKESTLTGVRIQYMDCNGSVFEPGDRVVVEMQGRSSQEPRVIGFESNPRECGLAFLCLSTSSYCSINYSGNPFRAKFYKVNFKTYEISLHSEVDVASSSLLALDGYYVHERDPRIGTISNPQCEFSFGEFADYGILSTVNGFSAFSATGRGIVSPAKISDSEGVGISIDIYLPGADPNRRETTLIFFDLDTLTKTDEFTHFELSGSPLFERVVANQDAIIVQTYRDFPDYYGLMSFDRDNNFMARYDYGDTVSGAVTGIAANAKYVFVVAWGEKNRLFVHDAKTLAITYTMEIPFADQKVAATSSHVILCRSKSPSQASADGRTEIYKISEDDGFSLELKKTAYWYVADGNTLFPIA